MSLAYAMSAPAPADTRFTPALLEGARGRADPLADAAVAAMAESGQPLRDPAQATRALAEAGDPACRALLEQLLDTPSWVVPELLLPGGAMALRHIVPSSFALLAGSLLESYAAPSVARVLTRTGRLHGDTYKRLMETVQFVSDVGVHRGPRPGTPAFEQTLAVRLMHAWARRRCRAGWDTEAWGAPIHQADSALLVTLFSHVFRRGVEAMGVRLSAEEHEGICHCWRYTGHLLGVEEALLATSPEEEEALYLTLSERAYAPDEDSRALTRAVLRDMSGRPPFLLPEAALRAVARRVLGAPLADALDIAPAPLAAPAVELACRTLSFDQLVVDKLPRYGARRVSWGETLVEAIQRSGLKERTRYGLTPETSEA